MARSEKHTADYFPFIVKEGKTLFILEGKYQCKGTGFFTNTLRFLCETPNHYYCIAEESDRLYFFSRTKCDEQSGMDMLDIMSKTGKINSTLWISRKVIASNDLLESIKGAYRDRKNKIITMEEIEQKFISSAGNTPTADKPAQEIHSQPDNQQETSAGNTQKRKEKKRKNNPLTPLTVSQQEKFNKFYSVYPKKKSPGQAEKAFLKINPDETLLDAILIAINKAKKSEDWLKENGRYIPHPATWLNARGWEDEINPVKNGGNGNADKSPYIFCERCGGEVRPDDFITEGGIKFCIKCPEVSKKIQSGLTRVNNFIGAIGKPMPAAAG